MQASFFLVGNFQHEWYQTCNCWMIEICWIWIVRHQYQFMNAHTVVKSLFPELWKFPFYRMEWLLAFWLASYMRESNTLYKKNHCALFIYSSSHWHLYFNNIPIMFDEVVGVMKVIPSSFSWSQYLHFMKNSYYFYYICNQTKRKWMNS